MLAIIFTNTSLLTQTCEAGKQEQTSFCNILESYHGSRPINKQIKACLIIGYNVSVLNVRVPPPSCSLPISIRLLSVLRTQTSGTGMLPSEHWGGTIYIYWAGTNLHLPTRSGSEAEEKRKNQQTSATMQCTARWSIPTAGAASRLFPRERSSGEHTNPPLHKIYIIC